MKVGHCSPLLASLVSLALAGCGSGNMTDLEEYVQQVNRREPAPIEALPEIKAIDTFVFEPADRRDPFVMAGQVSDTSPSVSTSGIAPNPLRRKEELERFALDALKMVGTLEQDDARWGLVRTADGTLYRVRVGNYVGTNNGQITRITDDGIELTEIVSDGTNEWRERQAAIALSQ